MQAKTHTAFPLIDFKPETYSPKIAVLSAVNKLKEAEEKILQAKHREIVQKRIEQSILAREEDKKKTELFKKMVRKSVDMQKDLKYQSQTKREKEIEKLHELNMTFRESKFKFRETVKSVQKEQNRQIYEQTKSQREKNEELVKEFKKRELQLKKSHRQRMSEREQKSKERVEQFRKSRIIFIQKQRQKDVEELEKKISSKTKYLEKFIESKNDFANSRTRLRYKSNSSFHNDGEKSQSELNRSNVGKIVQNFKVNSMIVANPEHEIDENIFGLTESKKGQTIELENSDQKEKIKDSIEVKKSQQADEQEVPQNEIQEFKEHEIQKSKHEQVKEQSIEQNNVEAAQQVVKSQTPKKKQDKVEKNAEQPLGQYSLEENNKNEQNVPIENQKIQNEQSIQFPVVIKNQGFKQSPVQASINS